MPGYGQGCEYFPVFPEARGSHQPAEGTKLDPPFKKNGVFIYYKNNAVLEEKLEKNATEITVV